MTASPPTVATALKRRHSYTTAVLDYFRAHPKEWIDAHVLMELGGSMAWRTRVADARKVIKKEGGVLENRVQYPKHEIERDADGQPARLFLSTRPVISQYRYLPWTPIERSHEETGQRRLALSR